MQEPPFVSSYLQARQEIGGSVTRYNVPVFWQWIINIHSKDTSQYSGTVLYAPRFMGGKGIWHRHMLLIILLGQSDIQMDSSSYYHYVTAYWLRWVTPSLL